MKASSILLLFFLSSCYTISIGTICHDKEYQANITRYYYENQFDIPDRKIHVFTERVDTTMIFINTPRRLETTIVFTDRDMTYIQRDSIVRKAFDYVLKDKR